ncbi:MAG: transporter [Sphingomonas bacterium]|nr:transporter [Sphingomonas bacterium]
MSDDPRKTILERPMSRFQVLAVAVTVGLNALDGFDVLAISFASPGIAAEWGIERGALGVVLAMELFGMAVGSMTIGGIADRIGRRPTILACLAVMACGMFLCTMATGILSLSIFRVLTGLGIGGMLAAINAVAAEFANGRRRNLAVSIMAIGYPVGAVIGGTIAAVLLQHFTWRAVFLFGAIVSACFIPLVLWRVPESIHFLTKRQPAGALDRVNRTLRRMGHPVSTGLPAATDEEKSQSVMDIFRPALLPITAAVTAAYFLHVTTFYFMLKWIPKIVADMGFTAAEAASTLVWANVGGAAGGAVLGLLTQRFALKPLTIGVLVVSSVAVTVFGYSSANLSEIAILCAISGFFTNAGIVGLYAIVAQSFPTHVRATGTGFVVGLGRGGSALAPIIAGYLFQAGFVLPTVAMVMACGSILGAAVLLTLRSRPKADPASL